MFQILIWNMFICWMLFLRQHSQFSRLETRTLGESVATGAVWFLWHGSAGDQSGKINNNNDKINKIILPL